MPVTEALQDIYRLQAFVAVVQEGSLSAAAKTLHITQPALSTRVRLLEEGLGCVLMQRSARGMQCTMLGELVYGIAVDILQRMEHLKITVRNHLELREGFVHLGGGATAVAGIFPEAIAHYRKLYPHIQFTLLEQDSGSVLTALQDGSIDIGIITQNPVLMPNISKALPPNIQVHREIADRLEVIAHQNHPLVKMSDALQKVGKSLLPLHLNRPIT